MTKKTAEIRYKCPPQHKEELLRIGTEVLNLNNEQTFHSIMELGLQELRNKLNSNFIIKVEHIVNSATKRLFFETK